MTNKENELMDIKKYGFTIHVVTNTSVDHLVTNIHTHGLMKTKHCPELLLLVYDDMFAIDSAKYASDINNIKAFANAVNEIGKDIVNNDKIIHHGDIVKTSVMTFEVFTTLDRSMLFDNNAIVPVNRLLPEPWKFNKSQISSIELADHNILFYPCED